jgi:hypothetical protein
MKDRGSDQCGAAVQPHDGHLGKRIDGFVGAQGTRRLSVSLYLDVQTMA